MKQTIPMGTPVECPTCHHTCKGGVGLSAHLRASHGTRLTASMIADIVAKLPTVSRKKARKPVRKIRKLKKSRPQVSQPAQAECHGFHFHFCPECGTALSQMEQLISMGAQISSRD